MAKLIVDGKEIEARDGRTLLPVLRGIGVRIPTLCFHEAVSPYGACRLCLVEVTAGKRTLLAASCMYPVAEGLVVKTASERVIRARRMVAELLLARCPGVPRVREIAGELGVQASRFPQRDERCVLCGLCVRGCAEIAGVHAIDFASRGVYMDLAPPFHRASETCVGCTTCVTLCPTGCLDPLDFRMPPSRHRFSETRPAAGCTLCASESFRSDHGH
ncbi:MAG: (2Fe-2S)-binding protein [Planctomycetes bacterium]|nr:(2Fe-2S)-binding protein [Planctomycetota bacterium]